MALDWLLGALLLVAVGLLIAVGRRLVGLQLELQQVDADLQRALADGRHQAERLATLEKMYDAQATAEQVLAAGGSVVREVHKGLAAIPFDVLEAMSSTRAPAKVVREVHDTISDGVYGALSGINKAVGRELRKGLKNLAESKAGLPPEGSEGPVGPPAPPSGRRLP